MKQCSDQCTVNIQAALSSENKTPNLKFRSFIYKSCYSWRLYHSNSVLSFAILLYNNKYIVLLHFPLPKVMGFITVSYQAPAWGRNVCSDEWQSAALETFHQDRSWNGILLIFDNDMHKFLSFIHECFISCYRDSFDMTSLSHPYPNIIQASLLAVGAIHTRRH